MIAKLRRAARFAVERGDSVTSELLIQAAATIENLSRRMVELEKYVNVDQ